MRLIIHKTPVTESFFRFSPHICQSYGIDFYTNQIYYHTKEFPNDNMSALGLLSLDEILTRHAYADYDERNIDINEIESFTEIANDPDNIMGKLINLIKDNEFGSQKEENI